MDIALMLCYFFPPLAGGGVQRSAKFVKYLPENGWAPIVISVQPNLRNKIEQGVDESLLQDIPVDTEVIRCKSVELSHLYYLFVKLHVRKVLFEFERLIPLMHMDYKIGWYPFALNAAKKIIDRLPVKIVYSTSPPYASHFLGWVLQKLYGLPWVADFRDPWTLMSTYKPPTRAHKCLECGLEGHILSNADLVIANTSSNKMNLMQKFLVAPEKIHVIPNGFDPQDFDGHWIARPDTQQFMISCVGKFYEMPQFQRFFKAYRRFSDEHPEAYLRFFGWHSRDVRKAAKSILADGTWGVGDRIQHNAAIKVMRSSAVLLGNLPTKESMHWVPGKLYEYLAARRPILFIGPKKGDAAKIIRKTRTGVIVRNDENEIYNALANYHRRWRAGLADWNPSLIKVHQFDRRVQTKYLCQAFNLITGKSTSLPLAVNHKNLE